MSAICKKYGIDYYYMLWEPFLPKLAGDLDQYPKEALGKVKRPWGGDKDGLDITLCVNSPIVREHYRNMIEKFVREFPDVRGVLFYNMDGSSWLCTPELCDRCKIVCKDSPQNEHNPWEAQASLVTTLAEAAHKVNPAFDFRLWGTVHYHGERCSKLLHAAEGYASLLSNWNGSDHDIMVADAAVPTSGFLESQKICKERKIPFFALSCFSNLEPVPHSLPFPFHVCDTLKKFKGWGVQCIEEHTGPIPGHNPINALVMKEFQCNPDRNPKEFLSGLSVRQFGKKAGPWMCRAWEEIEKAFDVWNDMPFNPFCGSQFHLSIGGDSFPEPILPDLAEKYNYENAIRIKVEPFKAAEYQKFKEQALLDKMILVNGYLARAVKYAKKAVAAASEKEFIGICYFEGVSGRPTCKEYAELNYASIAIADALCRQRGNRLRAYHLLTEIENTRAGGDEKSAKTKEKLYRELVREDLGVQEGFCELLVGFAKTRPGYTRASLTDRELSDWLSTTLATIKTMKECLDN